MPSILYLSLPNYFSSVSKTNVLLFFLAIIDLVYLITGAVVFSKIEAPQEEFIKANVQKHMEDFLVKNPSVSGKDLDELIQVIVDANSKGISTENMDDSNWSFDDSFFFVTTIITTIGYGHVTPLTLSGKSICILFAIIGIPLQLLIQTAFAGRLKNVCEKGLTDFFQSPYKTPVRRMIDIIYMIIILVAIVCGFLLIPAAIFDFMEPSWNYLDSFYYCFISLTSIGLGDYVPGIDANSNQGYKSAYKIVSTLYLLISQPFVKLFVDIIASKTCIHFRFLFKTGGETNENNERQPLLPVTVS